MGCLVFVSQLLCIDRVVHISVLDFYYFVICWKGVGVLSSDCDSSFRCLAVSGFLFFRVFRSSLVWCVYVLNLYVFWWIDPYSIVYCSSSSPVIFSVVSDIINTATFNVCKVYLFLFFYFQPTCVVELEVNFLQVAYS